MHEVAVDGAARPPRALAHRGFRRATPPKTPKDPAHGWHSGRREKERPSRHPALPLAQGVTPVAIEGAGHFTYMMRTANSLIFVPQRRLIKTAEPMSCQADRAVQCEECDGAMRARELSGS
jgi:hypothetical protein